MTKDQELIAWLHQTFHLGRQVIECLHKSTAIETTVCEIDGEDTVCIFSKTDQAGLRIRNPNQKEIHLFCLDHCFFTTSEYGLKRCDCLLFDDHYCCFVELKLNIKEWGNYKKKAKEAVIQLEETILFFESSIKYTSQKFFGYEREAYIVTRDHIYPKNQSSRENRRVNFLQKYGVTLYETNIKEF